STSISQQGVCCIPCGIVSTILNGNISIPTGSIIGSKRDEVFPSTRTVLHTELTAPCHRNSFFADIRVFDINIPAKGVYIKSIEVASLYPDIFHIVCSEDSPVNPTTFGCNVTKQCVHDCIA